MSEYIYHNEYTMRVSAFLGGFLVLALWEYFSPKRKLTQNKSKRWLNNFVLIVSSTIVVRLALPAAVVGIAYLSEQNHWGFVNQIEMPFWAKVLITFVFLDLSIYLQHVIFHVAPQLWRFHRVHHTDMGFDVTTGIRFHPVEIMISILIKGAAVVSVGAPPLAVILFEIVLNMMSMFTHSNIYLNQVFEKYLRWIIVTPDMHRIHHSVVENETNSNFSFNISLWDRIFGTYIPQPADGQPGMTIGLNQFREPEWQGIKGLLKTPFSSGVRGYAVNCRDSKNEEELAIARDRAGLNIEKAQLATELASYLKAIGELALVSIADLDGNIIDVNEKFCEISGYTRKELIGQNHRVVNSGYHPDNFFRDMWATITSGNVWRGEVCNKTKQGDHYWVDSTIVPVYDADGNVNRYLSVRVDITDKKNQTEDIEQAYQQLSEANAQLEEISRTDALTGIANRRGFDETLLAEITRESRVEAPLTLIFCDIDYFKLYNDTYGHLAGDECLRKVAEVIRSCLTRASDLVARYGGEEFAIILPNVDKESALIMAERVRESIQALKLEHTASPSAGVVTMSVGVTTMVPDKDTLMRAMIQKADAALYQAKAQGRNNVQYLE